MLKKKLISENISIKIEDPINIYAKVQEPENRVDAFSFKFYNLEKSEVQLVLESLQRLDNIKEGILSKF